MTPKEQLEDLNLFLENAVDQLERCQRTGRAGGHGIEEFDTRIDRAFAEIAALRNEVREALMKELAKGPKKLPIV